MSDHINRRLNRAIFDMSKQDCGRGSRLSERLMCRLQRQAHDVTTSVLSRRSAEESERPLRCGHPAGHASCQQVAARGRFPV